MARFAAVILLLAPTCLAADDSTALRWRKPRRPGEQAATPSVVAAAETSLPTARISAAQVPSAGTPSARIAGTNQVPLKRFIATTEANGADSIERTSAASDAAEARPARTIASFASRGTTVRRPMPQRQPLVSRNLVRQVGFSDPIGDPFAIRSAAYQEPVPSRSTSLPAAAVQPAPSNAEPTTAAGAQPSSTPRPFTQPPAQPLARPLSLNSAANNSAANNSAATQATSNSVAGDFAPPLPPLSSPRAQQAQAQLPSARLARRTTNRMGQDAGNPNPGGQDPGSQEPPAIPSQTYNLRDCGKEAEACQKAREMLSSYPISQISLDISPPIMPSAESSDEEERSRAERLSDVQDREWRDRSGRVVAAGRMVDLRFEKVWIQDEQGAIQKVPMQQLSGDDLCYVGAWWGIPTECILSNDIYQPRNPHPLTMTWTASAACNKPLYFEEVQLERYGHTHGPFLQPVVSGAHFVANIATIPYKMGMNPPQECRYTLGYYRPGDCAPWLLPPIPLSVPGALRQAGAIAGGVNIFP